MTVLVKPAGCSPRIRESGAGICARTRPVADPPGGDPHGGDPPGCWHRPAGTDPPHWPTRPVATRPVAGTDPPHRPVDGTDPLVG